MLGILKYSYKHIFSTYIGTKMITFSLILIDKITQKNVDTTQETQ